MHIRPGTFLSAVLFSFVALSAQAADVRPLVKAGIDFGGDTLVTVTFVGGGTESIKANDGLFFGGGIAVVNDAKTIESELSLTYKFGTIEASNGDVTFSRLPLDALVFYLLPKARIGAGVTYHMNPELDGSGVASGLNVDFKDSAGFLLQAEYRITEKMNVGARYTALKYDVEGGTGDVRSNGLGITFSASF
jgi:hypothetical protein